MALLRCTEAFSVWQGGIPRVLRPGDVVEDSDSCVEGRERYFEPIEVQVERDRTRLEAATAAPGEKRTRTAPRRRAAAKKTAAKKS
jgi:hypothetical protein